VLPITAIMGFTNAAHCHLLNGCLTQSLSYNSRCESYGFFNAHPLNQASLFRGFALKKPLICMRGFVVSIGASLEEFAADVSAILEAKIKNL